MTVNPASRDLLLNTHYTHTHTHTHAETQTHTHTHTDTHTETQTHTGFSSLGASIHSYDVTDRKCVGLTHGYC